MDGDPSLRDEELEREIALVGALMLAAGLSDGRMSEQQIDEILAGPPDVAAPDERA